MRKYLKCFSKAFKFLLVIFTLFSIFTLASCSNSPSDDKCDFGENSECD